MGTLPINGTSRGGDEDFLKNTHATTWTVEASYVHSFIICHARRRGSTFTVFFGDIVKLQETISPRDFLRAASHFKVLQIPFHV